MDIETLARLYSHNRQTNKIYRLKLSAILQKELRKRNITAYQLAGMLQSERRTVYRWTTGHAFPEPTKLLQLIELLDINVRELCE